MPIKRNFGLSVISKDYWERDRQHILSITASHLRTLLAHVALDGPCLQHSQADDCLDLPLSLETGFYRQILLDRWFTLILKINFLSNAAACSLTLPCLAFRLAIDIS